MNIRERQAKNYIEKNYRGIRWNVDDKPKNNSKKSSEEKFIEEIKEAVGGL